MVICVNTGEVMCCVCISGCATYTHGPQKGTSVSACLAPTPPALLWGALPPSWRMTYAHLSRCSFSPGQGMGTYSKPQALSPEFEIQQKNIKAEIHPVGYTLKEQSLTPTASILKVQALGHLIRAKEVEINIHMIIYIIFQLWSSITQELLYNLSHTPWWQLCLGLSFRTVFPST